MHPAPQYDYDQLTRFFFDRLKTVLGPDIVIETTYKIPEIQLDSIGRIKVIQNPQIALEKLTNEINELSPYVSNHILHELETIHGSR